MKRAKLTPILLFNEADAIIGKRKSGAENAVDKMENSLQNIILQEMEQLDGIMIATTNLQQNMDKAFERRFLYKIKFEKPTVEARASIWHAMIPELNEMDVQALASKYDFSGGQIENIARHYAIDSILHGVNDDALAFFDEVLPKHLYMTSTFRVFELLCNRLENSWLQNLYWNSRPLYNFICLFQAFFCPTFAPSKSK